MVLAQSNGRASIKQRVSRVVLSISAIPQALADDARLSAFIRDKFSGKSVAIVGGGPELKCLNMGAEIDDHDLVVRLNLLSQEGMERKLGSRTDVRFIGCTLLDAHLNHLAPVVETGVIISTRKNAAVMQRMRINCLFYHRRLPQKAFRLIEKSTGFVLHDEDSLRPPRSGMVFLALLLTLANAKEINLYGFSKSIDSAMNVIDYRNNGITAYDEGKFLMNHCHPRVEIELLRFLEQQKIVRVR